MSKKYLEDLFYNFINRNWDMRGKRMVNAGDPIALQDYVTLKYIQNRQPKVSSGSLQPNEKPTNPVVGDIFISTDFLHTYRYSGTAWVRICCASDTVIWCRTNPGLGYQLCDGSANIRISNSNGSTSLITVPDLNNGTFPRFGAAYSGPAPTSAVAPTLSGTSAVNTTGITVASHGVIERLDAAGIGAWVFDQEADADHVVNDLGHSHGIGTYVSGVDGLPKLMDGLPYIRL